MSSFSILNSHRNLSYPPLQTDHTRRNIDCTKVTFGYGVTEPITCQLLIYGDERESYDYNCHIFSCVQSFIVKTKRFI